MKLIQLTQSNRYVTFAIVGPAEAVKAVQARLAPQKYVSTHSVEEGDVFGEVVVFYDVLIDDVWQFENDYNNAVGE